MATKKEQICKRCERIHLIDVINAIVWTVVWLPIGLFAMIVFWVINAFYNLSLAIKGEPVWTYKIFDFYVDKKLRYKQNKEVDKE